MEAEPIKRRSERIGFWKVNATGLGSRETGYKTVETDSVRTVEIKVKVS